MYCNRVSAVHDNACFHQWEFYDVKRPRTVRCCDAWLKLMRKANKERCRKLIGKSTEKRKLCSLLPRNFNHNEWCCYFTIESERAVNGSFKAAKTLGILFNNLDSFVIFEAKRRASQWTIMRTIFIAGILVVILSVISSFSIQRVI